MSQLRVLRVRSEKNPNLQESRRKWSAYWTRGIVKEGYGSGLGGKPAYWGTFRDEFRCNRLRKQPALTQERARKSEPVSVLLQDS